MRAGPMRYRLELLRPERRVDEYGSESVTFVHAGTAHAERVKATGVRSEEAGEHFPAYSVSWNVHDAHPVAENRRVRQFSPPGQPYTYVVTNVVPLRERGMLTLVTERLNE